MLKNIINFFIISFILNSFSSARENIFEWNLKTKTILLNKIVNNPNVQESYKRILNNLELNKIDVDYVKKIFFNSKIKIDYSIIRKFENQTEKLPYKKYKNLFITKSRIKNGVLFYYEKKPILDLVFSNFGVDPFLLVSLAGIESNYGAYTSSYLVFNSLHTQLHNKKRKVWAEKEMTEFIKYCFENKIDPFSVNGSYAGAFGYGQFIPSSFRAYAVDFDGDNIKEPFDWSDVLASMSNYLIKNGYKKNSKDFSFKNSNWSAIYKYNHSENYVNVILELRRNIINELSQK